ncbi:MAG: glycosyltransferase family 2 protein [Chitinophagales bacterium]
MINSQPDISIIVPAYNEQEVLPEFYKAICQHRNAWNGTSELVFVNDGSSDNTSQILNQFADADETVRVIHLSRNFGHQPALSAGMAAAKGKAIVMMDADLQDPPELIQELIVKWKAGFEVVYAIRESREGNAILNFGYRTFYYWMNKSSSIYIPMHTGDFGLIDRKVVDIILYEFPEKNRFLRGLRAFTGFNQTGVNYARPKRANGNSKYSFRKLLALALDGWFGFSNKPLRIATYLGILFAVPSFLIGILYILNKLFGITIFTYPSTDQPGVATLTVAVFFIGGIMLIILGIIGEYISRIYEEIKGRPTYIVREEYSVLTKAKRITTVK